MAGLIENADGSRTIVGNKAGEIISYSGPNKSSVPMHTTNRGGIVDQLEYNGRYIRAIIKNSFSYVASCIKEGQSIVNQQSIETNFDQSMHNHFDILVKGMDALSEKTTLLCDILDDYASAQERIDNQDA